MTNGLERAPAFCWRKDRGEKDKGKLEFWFASQDNGFQIVRFTRDV